MKGKQGQKPLSSSKNKKITGANKSTKTGKFLVPVMLTGILILSFIVYLPILHNTFLAWDDNYYIRDNSLIYSLNLKDIFSHNVMGNYHPLTILILAIEYQLFGLSETCYHAVNLGIHLSNIILVFYAVFLLSGKKDVALIASLFFGIHPIHVESVAWAAELKDLLYTLFFLSSFIFYLKYIYTFQRKYFFLSIILFLLSLLSKGMAASFPVVLLLADFFRGRKFTKQVLLEKIPFFTMAILFGAIAIAAQKTPDIVQDITDFTFPQRIAFAFYGFFTYLAKIILPINLSAYYPYPVKNGNSIPLFYYGYILLMLGVLVSIVYSLRFTKKIIFGIGFFAITIFLVLQLLPVGDAIMADRYSYVPSIGIFYLFGEGFNFLRNKKLQWLSIAIVIGLTIFFGVLTQTRTRVWKTDMTLWEDVLGRFQTIPIAYYNRGLAFMNENRFNEAAADYTKAISLKPGYNEALVNRGNIFRVQKQNEEALKDYNDCIDHNPNFSKAYFNRGILFMNLQQNEEAIRDFSKSIELNPNYYKAYSNRGVIYNNAKRYEEAIQDYSRALEIKPDYVEAWYNRAMVEYASGNKEAACNDLRQSANLGFQTAIDAIPNFCK